MQAWRGAFRQAVLGVLRSPVQAAVAIVTLAVGIGATAAVFTVVNSVLLQPLPFRDAGRLVAVWHTAAGLGFERWSQSPATYLTYRDENRVFENIGLWKTASVSVTAPGEPERVEALLVSDGTLAALAARPHLGQLFRPEDDTPGAPLRALVAYGYWQRRFGEDQRAVGRTLVVDGVPAEILGILPRDFKFLRSRASIVLPMKLDRSRVFVGNFSFQAVARLKQGVTLEQANKDVARMIPLTLDRFPLLRGQTPKMFNEMRLGPNVIPLKRDLVGDVDRVLWLLLGAVGVVLLIACANVANLVLVRAEGRYHEVALRIALGASRRHIAALFLSEAVTLALVAGAGGLYLAHTGVRVLVAIGPATLPRLDEIGVDWSVFVFTFALSIFSALLFGAMPVVRYATARAAAAIRHGTRSATADRSRSRTRSALVVAQVALALVLLVGCGLMVRTLVAMRNVRPGFTHPEQVLTFQVPMTRATGSPERLVMMHEELVARIRRLPGIQSVGLCTAITMSGGAGNEPVYVQDFPQPEGQIAPFRRFKWISPGYFQAMGNRLVAGRSISWDDVHTAAPVVMITENLAREYWKSAAAAVGRRIRQNVKDPWREIVGVVGDERDDGVTSPAVATVYWPMLVGQYFGSRAFVPTKFSYAVRTARTGSPTLLDEILHAVRAVNPSLPVATVRTVAEIRDDSMGQTSFAMVMLAIAAMVALLLGLVGIYAVVAYTASRRTREIGVRVALGAQRRDIIQLLLGHAALLVGAGAALGLCSAVAATTAMRAVLFGVSPLDPATFVFTAALVAIVGLAASYLPARRAAALDPADMLRRE